MGSSRRLCITRGARYTARMEPSDALEKLFRLTPPQRAALRRLGIHTVENLLRHFPSRYEAAGEESPIAGLVAGSEATIYGTIGNLDTRRSWKRRIPVGEAVIRDSSGSIKVMWFHQPYLAKKFSEGMFVKAVGAISGKGGKPYLANPHVEAADPVKSPLLSRPRAPYKEAEGALFAVYPESRGITSLWFRHAIERVMQSGALERLIDPLPDDVREKYSLPSLQSSLRAIHAPNTEAHAKAARKRFAFEEIFAINVARALERRQNDSLPSFCIKDGARLADTFTASLPFSLTAAQKRAIRDIVSDFARPHPMARLLEGDVGSGKTAVAAATSYAVVKSRPLGQDFGTLQVAYMAPTEILATQHFNSFIEFFRELPISIALITGSGCRKFPSKSSPGQATSISRAQLLKWVENGEIAMVVGTHALIQKTVRFKHLAYAIVDEQHRFGTAQRRALAKKESVAPHFLSMTATPIPRTLALTLYGDLDLSVLDELPPGRAVITTRIVKNTGEGRQEAYEKIRAELALGRQAYVICPRIEEPDPEKANALQAKSAKAEAKRLAADVFPKHRIGLLHGAMKPAEKDEAMARFADHELDILVATSVVEVGVNVPNATVILIEGAERFGLAQLHQLRGRVMRSSHPPYCFLLPETNGSASLARLRALEKSTDGFVLAEKDLETRGAGDLLGRRQWGMTDLGMEALQNIKLIRAAREEASALIERDPALSAHAALRRRLEEAGQFHAE
ncbi:ATP-dependent DNA helicase RecG [Candidatus Kaiserbacteria bacterium CG10_big_fil_rev_8_21_14_0_10_59_10]|uniref:Probable DNA 3'-5' helicase RecG n=1 Tax=Candidatus Kaiserbacteria bacterium CG10_big_fil_rev_8_21_14_0_10_59_10 TaxID=1974612 RepID=A0A2H0U8P3_9BACT|nr:MAG: ATP-dependent DNA helicase RecG [Candidatus Kaiserbacteria bacterium CG10_big_fil_rev_8_21_14_0_10_59_10]